MSNSSGNPTLVPAENFDPAADAQALRNAMEEHGCDTDALINIICRRSNDQRQSIRSTYESDFGKDLIGDIRSETRSDFEDLLVALLKPTVDSYVEGLHDAMSKWLWKEKDVLIEVLCSLSNSEIRDIKEKYERRYNESLENKLKSSTSSDFEGLMVSLCAAARDETGVVDNDAANRDATELLRAGELRAGTDGSKFNEVFTKRNFAQIKLICEKYEEFTGHGLDEAIEKEFEGDIKNGLLAILQCSTNKAEFFAKCLHDSMVGMGTKDRKLIRLIVTRSEIDLNDIKKAFEGKYKKSLRCWIEGDTSGPYKRALLVLCGEQP